MNIVPHVGFSPIPMLDRLMQVARQNPNAVAHIQRLAYRYGPAAMAHVRQFLDHAGYRAGRAVRDWIGRHVRPRRNQFMHNVRTGLQRQQMYRAERMGRQVIREGWARPKSSDVRSNPVQVRGSRGFVGRRRGGQLRRRGGGLRRVRPMRFGGRPMSRPEMKAYDLGTSSSITSTMTLIQVPVRDLPLGVTSSQRVGRKVFCKSLLMAGKIFNTVLAPANATSDSVWFWVVLDRQANGATATAADIWSNSTGATALRNLDQGPRFKILKCVEVKVDAVAAGTHINQPFEFYIPLNFSVHWKGAANDPPYKNNILVFVANSNNLDETLAVDHVSRVRFTDV